jgi:hypothetical protein
MTLKDRHYALLVELAQACRQAGYTTTGIAHVLDAASNLGDVHPLQGKALWRIAYSSSPSVEEDELEELDEDLERHYDEG